MNRRAFAALPLVLVLAACAGRSPPPESGLIADWIVSELIVPNTVGVSIRGEPRVVASPWGDAVAFDGRGDAIFLDHNPLAGRDRFTIEVVMRPHGGGPPEQRYLHFGEPDGDRVLLETRVTPDRRWYHDSYVRSGEQGLALIDPTLLHPTDEWYHVALVFDRGWFATYLDGRLELEGSLEFEPLPEGRTSIGVRMNEVHWYRGEFQRIRITDRPLQPEEFIRLGGR
jgi:hypothetical protein